MLNPRLTKQECASIEREKQTQKTLSRYHNNTVEAMQGKITKNKQRASLMYH